MPIAEIAVLAGHPRPTLQRLLREVSRAYAEVLGAPQDRLQVWIEERDPGLYAIGGEPAEVALATADRAEVEVPLVRLYLLGDRPRAQIGAAIARLTQVVAEVLGGDPDRVRVAVIRVPPEEWGIGGVPASERRRAEIEARKPE